MKQKAPVGAFCFIVNPHSAAIFPTDIESSTEVVALVVFTFCLKGTEFLDTLQHSKLYDMHGLQIS